MVLPAIILLIAGLLRYRFAINIWRKLYILGLVYVIVLIARAVFLLLQRQLA